MSKYEPLEQFLRSQATSEVPMRFSEIETVIGGKLPPAAHAHRAWWSNNPSNNVMTKSWLAAGFVSERVDMATERLVFRRQGRAAPSISGPALTVSPETDGDWLAELRKALAGTITFIDGVDLTKPTGELWDAER